MKNVLWSVHPAHHSQTKHSVLTVDFYYLSVYGGREGGRERGKGEGERERERERINIIH